MIDFVMIVVVSFVSDMRFFLEMIIHVVVGVLSTDVVGGHTAFILKL
jgi:hypothetical protein